MKNTTLVLLLALISCPQLAAQGPPNYTGIIFSTQSQLDSFPINCPGCTVIDDNVLISGPDITSLQGLNGVDSILGGLIITDNPLLESLHGLEDLTYVGFGFFYTRTFFGSFGLHIWKNDQLTTLSGLEGLKELNACLDIGGNVGLKSLKGLDSLRKIGTCSSGNLSYISYRSLSISDNAGLLSLSGLSKLDSLFSSVRVSNNDTLKTMHGLNNLKFIGGEFQVVDNALVNFNGLDSLTYIGSFFEVDNNTSLRNFQGLEQLDSIGDYLDIYGNDSLISFDGLNKLQSIGTNLSILYHPLLSSLNGLDNLQTIGGELIISQNPSLSMCSVSGICLYLANGPAGPVQIILNHPGCNNIAEVEMACVSPVSELFLEPESIRVFPNPVSSELQLGLTDADPLHLRIFDTNGRLVFQDQVIKGQIINVKGWSAGLYFIQAVSRNNIYSGKFIKE